MKLIIFSQHCSCCTFAPNGKCPSGHHDYPTFLADTVECGVFYECVGVNPKIFRCPPGTYWDIKKTTCDEEVICGDLSTTPGLPTPKTLGM
ncbi:hypothetical protein JTB14_035782 [Gonioctena quinquepunctata]|nr:hypothetical protein JTB14_035782 [Gonioctena quinquepunctata]